MKGKNDGKSKREPEDRQKAPEEQISKIGGEDKEEVSGITQGALRGLGKMIPGFGDLLKGLEKSEAFQERLKEVDIEVEHELERATSLKEGRGVRRSAIPPRTALKRSGLRAGEGIIPPRTTARAVQTTSRKQARAPIPRKEIVAEILDEGDHINVIVEMPGFTERTIEAQVKGHVLIIKAHNQGQRYQEEIELPCSVKDRVELKYRNGVLQIALDKLKE
jgi:HSP20 family molecular chaperone IbpA